MATKKITDLELVSACDATLNLPVDDTTQTYRMTVAQLNTYLRSNFSGNRNLLKNVGLSVTASAGAATVALKQSDGSTNPSSDAVLKSEIGFRSTTLTSGAVASVDFTAALSLVIPSGATMNYVSGQDARVFVYAYYDGTNKGLMVCRLLLDENELHNFTAISTSSDFNGKYADAIRTSAAIRLIGEFQCTAIATAGTWVTPTYVSTRTWNLKQPQVKALYNHSAAGTIVSGTIVDFSTKVIDTHNAVTTGASWIFTAPIAGTYTINAFWMTTAATAGTLGDLVGFGGSKNADGAQKIFAISRAHTTSSCAKSGGGSMKLDLAVGDTFSVIGQNNTGQTNTRSAVAIQNYVEITLED